MIKRVINETRCLKKIKAKQTRKKYFFSSDDEELNNTGLMNKDVMNQYKKQAYTEGWSALHTECCRWS